MVRPRKGGVCPPLKDIEIRALTHTFIRSTVAHREVLLYRKGQHINKSVVAVCDFFSMLCEIMIALNPEATSIKDQLLHKKGQGRKNDDHIEYLIGLILDIWHEKTGERPTASMGTKYAEAKDPYAHYCYCVQFVLRTVEQIRLELASDVTPESIKLSRHLAPSSMYRRVKIVIQLDRHRWE